MGGGLAAVSRGASPRRRAPDRTQLLPRQVISGGDATAQDAATDCLKSDINEDLMSKGSHTGLPNRPLSTWTQLTDY